jgi:flagellar biosynthesis/type III secretory pathway protein FliH
MSDPLAGIWKAITHDLSEDAEWSSYAQFKQALAKYYAHGFSAGFKAGQKKMRERIAWAKAYSPLGDDFFKSKKLFEETFPIEEALK